MLGACRPPLAHGALPAEPSIGLSLPCNVVVRALGSGRTQVEALNPAVMVGVTENDARTGIADEATTRLNAALDTLPRVAFETFRRAVGGSGASPGSRTWRVGCSGPEGSDGGGDDGVAEVVDAGSGVQDDAGPDGGVAFHEPSDVAGVGRSWCGRCFDLAGELSFAAVVDEQVDLVAVAVAEVVHARGVRGDGDLGPELGCDVCVEESSDQGAVSQEVARVHAQCRGGQSGVGEVALAALDEAFQPVAGPAGDDVQDAEGL